MFKKITKMFKKKIPEELEEEKRKIKLERQQKIKEMEKNAMRLIPGKVLLEYYDGKTEYIPLNQRYNDKDLQEIKRRESINAEKLTKYGEDYYWSDEANTYGKETYRLKKEYLEKNPENFQIHGRNVMNTSWFSNSPTGHPKMYILVGKGKFYEDLENYEKSIKYYEKANEIFWALNKRKIDEIINEGHDLSEQIIDSRIRIVKDKIKRQEIKKLEEKAKEEENNPTKAIEIYKQLNQLNPGLKKYNKRIEILERKIKSNLEKEEKAKRKDKIKKLEEKAKEEENNPTKAIEIYKQLNQLNPGLKKYNKRIEIMENKIKKNK